MPNPPVQPPVMKLTSSFMQNYDCGTNLSGIAPGPENVTPFVASDGTLNFFTPGDDGSLLRIYQDRHSTSGYSVQKVHGAVMRESNAVPHPGDSAVMTATRAIVIPGQAGAPGQLICVVPSAVGYSLLLRWDLAVDGTIAAQKDGYIDHVGALVMPYCGNVLPGTQYLLEVRSDGSTSSGYRMGLRSLADFSFVPTLLMTPLLPSALWLGNATMSSAFDTRVFPLRTANPDVFRYLYVDDGGATEEVVLTRGAGQTAFQRLWRPPFMYGQPSHVHEVSPGKVQVVLMSPQARPAVAIWTGTYDPSSGTPATWANWTREWQQLPPEGFPAGSNGVTENLLTSWDQPSSTITTFLARSQGSPPTVFETWATALSTTPQQPMAPFGATPLAFLPTGRHTMLVRAGGSYQVWDRAADGAYTVDIVDADWEDQPVRRPPATALA